MALNEADFFNSAESILVSALQGESSVAALVTTVHEKLRDDPTLYSKAELPAAAVSGFAYRPDGYKKYVISLTVEVSDIGADIAEVDRKVKQILSVIIEFIKKEDPLRGGKGFDEQVDAIAVTQAVVVQWKPENQDWFFVGGSCQVDLTIVS